MLVVLALTPLSSAAQDRFALVIGNGKYVNIDPLPNPPNDVKLVAKALEDVGFSVTLLVNADRRTMDRAAKKFAIELDDAGQNSVGVFYFAGHGVTYEGENWLLPIGAEITQGADIEYETISANKVLKLMEGARNATDILILDACRNSPFRSFSLSGTRALSRGMSRMDAPTGSFIAYSTAPGAVAYDGDGSYSPFAEAFASEVATPVSSIGDMMIEVRKKVKAKTAKLGPQPQTPWDSSSLTGRFAFNPGPKTGSVELSPDPAPPKKDSQRQSGATADTRLWTSIENSTDPAEFEFYLKQYPAGQYAELARIRKDRFSKKAVVAPVGKIESQRTGKTSTGSSDDSEATRRCRQFAGDNLEAFSFCMDEYDENDGGDWTAQDGSQQMNDFPATMTPSQAGQSAVWYDDQFVQWQVSINGDYFTASAFLAGTGMVELRGQSQGYALSYGIFDSTGQQIGYGQGNFDDVSHISVISYWSNGALMGSGRFHVNHAPN